MNTDDLSITFINKIPQTSSIHNFIFKSQWSPNDIKLQILDCNLPQEWEGIISIDELKQSAEELEIPYAKFYNECKEALTHNGGIEYFEYTMENNKFTLTKTEEFRIQYLEVTMRHAYDLQQSLTLNSVDLIASLRNELSLVKNESNELNDKYLTVVKTLERCLQEKNNIEKKLLLRFAVLLNSKKDKIAELQNLLVEKNKRLEEAGLAAVETAKRKSTEASGSSVAVDDFMLATQVMTQPVVTLPKRQKFNVAEVVPTEVPGPSSSAVEVEAEVVAIDDSQDIFELMV